MNSRDFSRPISSKSTSFTLSGFHMQISKNAVVTLSYELCDSDGSVLEQAGSMLAYIHGAEGGIFPKVQAGLEGKGVGDEFSISLEPEDAFGDYDEQLIRLEPKEVFPANVEVGMQFEGVPPGENDDQWVVYTVTNIADGQVVVDGNHPLAGERLLFSCKVAEVRAATREELDHGHVHGAHGHQH
jgi:FKBP-type peptidyl-prolyl cis-trans isomerase SlyD